MRVKAPAVFVDDGLPRRSVINDLDCAVCGRWFRTFDHLAKHMYARHGPPTPRTQTHDAWAKQSGIATVQTEPFTPPLKRKRMATTAAKRRTAPAPTRTGAPRSVKRSARGGIPPPTQSANETEYNPFLKAGDIGDLDDRAKLTLTGKVRIADSGFGEQMICECKYDGKVYDWGFKVNGANHRILFKRFGKDERKWRGPVSVTVKEFNGNPYIAADRE